MLRKEDPNLPVSLLVSLAKMHWLEHPNANMDSCCLSFGHPSNFNLRLTTGLNSASQGPRPSLPQATQDQPAAATDCRALGQAPQRVARKLPGNPTDVEVCAKPIPEPKGSISTSR